MTTEDFAGIESSGTIAQNNVFVRIRTDLLVIGDSIITDRHHSSNGNYEDNDPQNQIGGIIPSFTLSGWLSMLLRRSFPIGQSTPGIASLSVWMPNQMATLQHGWVRTRGDPGLLSGHG